MAQPDPAEQIEALHARMAAIEERVDMEAGLRASLDRDYADVKSALAGQRRVLQAIGTTQGQHTAALAEVAGQLDALTVQVGGVSSRVDSLAARTDAGFARVTGRLDMIVGLLNRLIEEDRGTGPS